MGSGHIGGIMAAALWARRGRRTAAVVGTVARSGSSRAALQSQYDALVIGGGHNGLVAAAYLQKGGLKTAVLERRHVLGGAAVSEEIVPGFHFSRCSYLLSLLRPHIYADLELKKHGLKVYMRDPHAFTPMLEEGVKGAPPRSLTLGSDLAMNQKEIGKFSQKDAKAYPDFVAHLEKLAGAIHPLLDAPPVDIPGVTTGSLGKRLAAAKTLTPLVKCGLKLGRNVPDFYEIVTAPIMKILNRWFDSEPLIATLATDAVIGAMTSPSSPGSGYVLLHHVMGELEKEKGAWGYVEGGMGGVSQAIASAAQSYGVDIFTEKDVAQVLVGSDGAARGVALKDGTEISSRVVLSNATPYVTFKNLTPQAALSPEFIKAINQIDYTSPVTKINVAVDKLPNFLARPTPDGIPGPHHQCSIHLNCESVEVYCAFKRRSSGRTGRRCLTLRKWTKPPEIPADSTPIVPIVIKRVQDGAKPTAPPVQQQEAQMDCGAANPDPSDDATLSQDVLNGEDDLSEEEKVRRKAERRKAKRKRRRKRKKQEQVKESESAEQDNEDEDGGAESELDESESDGEVDAEEEKREAQKEEKKEARSSASHKCAATPVVAPSGIKGHQKGQGRSAEEEPEWDVSSAFFANAASHIKPKGSSRKSKENKENEARRETNGTDTMTKKSASLTEKGIKLVQEGQYAQAAIMFTDAIKCDPKDNRFFGNRSYCYYCLEQYPQALADAERSIQLAPDWPKGHFRKGSALMGMKRYSEAEKAMEQVLKLDKDCEEAATDLVNCKVLQLMELGFEEMQSVQLLEKFSTVQAVQAAYLDAVRAGSQDPSVGQPGSPCPSLWVGNVTTELTEKHLWDLFKVYGEIESIRVLHERFCAFVNFKKANMASRAMEKLNGYCIENTRLVVRHPDRRTQRVLPIPLKTCLFVTQQAGAAAGPRRRGPVNGDECYFWRTTGCHFGDKCRYKHIPDQKGKDRKPWQP
ncbi:hypothetical protein F2P81_020211 [Scophthalmus maximus]|uniref:Uncharacterized protein n=1 Tax=Scophthalmus maximus TaxID=52904 RepID=A0A6A4S7D8_SCOMX|nr:hypothetical protein F2P81_020211 [Scophthalmus maximus]